MALSLLSDKDSRTSAGSDRRVAEGVVRFESTQIVKALAREPPGVAALRLKGSRRDGGCFDRQGAAAVPVVLVAQGEARTGQADDEEVMVGGVAPLVDCNVHLWDQAANPVFWLTDRSLVRGMLGNYDSLPDAYTLADYQREVAGHEWVAFNAIAEHLDFGRRYRVCSNQVQRSFEDTALKQRALDLVLAA